MVTIEKEENDNRVNLPQYSLPNLCQNRQMQGNRTPDWTKNQPVLQAAEPGQYYSDKHPFPYFQTPAPAPSFSSTPCCVVISSRQETTGMWTKHMLTGKAAAKYMTVGLCQPGYSSGPIFSIPLPTLMEGL